VIVIFGATSDIGRRAAACILDKDHPVRLVAREPSDLDRRAERVAGTIAGAAAMTKDAEVVISCAHARFVPQLLQNIDGAVTKLVLLGSAWRYSRVPNPNADEVRSAEAAFLDSGRRGVMLHPTMIYGGRQENNVQQLISVIRRFFVIPLPGGGRHLVQPIYVEDVANCIVAAAERKWLKPTVIPVAGPKPMSWREMVTSCIREMGCRRILLPVPLGPMIALLEFFGRLGMRPPVNPDVLRRFREDVEISIIAMQTELGVSPRSFADGFRRVLAEN
jgi:nucleoside-diphosphate-sugar epimerase